MRKVGIVMGSKSDLPTVEKAISVLKEYGIETEVRVLSAHRCPDEAREFVRRCVDRVKKTIFPDGFFK